MHVTHWPIDSFLKAYWVAITYDLRLEERGSPISNECSKTYELSYSIRKEIRAQ